MLAAHQEAAKIRSAAETELERAKAEAQAHRWLGDLVDAPAAAGQPVPQAQKAGQVAPPSTPLPGASRR